MKRITALILVLVLVFSMASAAFAEKKSEKKTEKSPTVYVTGSSKVYHESDCPNTWKGRYKTTLQEAHKNRLKPCPECCPVEYDKENEETMEEPVYVVMGKAVYHCADCSLIWEDDVWYGTKMTLKKAQTNELRPCALCDPDSGTQKSYVYQVSEDGSYHTCDCRVIWKNRFKTTMDELPENAKPCAYCHAEED